MRRRNVYTVYSERLGGHPFIVAGWQPDLTHQVFRHDDLVSVALLDSFIFTEKFLTYGDDLCHTFACLLNYEREADVLHYFEIECLVSEGLIFMVLDALGLEYDTWEVAFYD